jgi:hypothetical protein
MQDKEWLFPLPCDPQMKADHGAFTFRNIRGSWIGVEVVVDDDEICLGASTPV